METLKIFFAVWVLAFILSIPGLWQVFKKLDIEAWKSLIPFYNFIVLMLYFKISLWYLLFLFFPYAILILEFIVGYRMAKSFGLDIGFAIGLTFWFTKPIFISILGFGNHEFIGREGIV
jgi:hypothetical protein